MPARFGLEVTLKSSSISTPLPCAGTASSSPGCQCQNNTRHFWHSVNDCIENNLKLFLGEALTVLALCFPQNHLPAARKAFDRFFSHYPYCYGYWKKYADLEKRHDNVKQSDEVRRARGQHCHQSQSQQWLSHRESLGCQCLPCTARARGTCLHVSQLWHLELMFSLFVGRCVKPLQFVKLCSASLCITLQLNK